MSAMVKNFLIVAVRNLWRNKLYTSINVLGLGVGLATIVWGWQVYRYSMSYNDFHFNNERVFWAIVSKEGSEEMKGISPRPLVGMAKADFSSIEKAVRWDSKWITIKADKGEAFSQTVQFTEPGFFEMFNFPVVVGSNDLSDPNSLLITEEMAVKYFGKENPLNKTLQLYAGEPYQRPLTVKGVLKDVPKNSSIEFEFLTSFQNQLDGDGQSVKMGDWAAHTGASFFMLRNPADAPRLAKDFNKYLQPQNLARPDWKVTGFELIPFSQAATRAEYLGDTYLYERPEDSAAIGPMVLAILIFLSSCLNFANTTVSLSGSRLREMGVRKVMGGSQLQLIKQLLFECGIIVFLAMLLSTQLNSWWMPFFNQMFQGVEAQADYFHDHRLLVFMGGLLVGTTLLAGAYPALYISRFNPSNIFSGSVKLGGSNLFSRLLLGFQVVVALITVVASVAFSNNSEFQRNYDFGFRRDDLMVLKVPNESSYQAMRGALDQLPGVEVTAGTRQHIGFGRSIVTVEVQGEKKETAYMGIGEGYLELMGIKLIAGRAFDPQLGADYENSAIVSQKFASVQGWRAEEALGQKLQIDSVAYSVVGVVQDFHAGNFFDPIEPMLISFARPEKYSRIVIRAKPGELLSVFDQTKAAWSRLFPLMPFNASYQDEMASSALQTTESIAKIFSWFAIVSILLSATGLFALVSLTVLKKTKEIAIRRVVGATSGHVMVLVNKGYFWIFMVASAIGSYCGYALTKLLMDLIFKVNVGVGGLTILVSVMAIMAIALATVGIKVWQALRSNPAAVLRGD